MMKILIIPSLIRVAKGIISEQDTKIMERKGIFIQLNCSRKPSTNVFRPASCAFPVHFRCFIAWPFGIESESRLESGSTFKKERAETR